MSRLWTLRANVALVLPEQEARAYDHYSAFSERQYLPGEEASYSLAFTSGDRKQALSDLIAALVTLRGPVDAPEPSK